MERVAELENDAMLVDFRLGGVKLTYQMSGYNEDHCETFKKVEIFNALFQ